MINLVLSTIRQKTFWREIYDRAALVILPEQFFYSIFIKLMYNINNLLIIHSRLCIKLWRAKEIKWQKEQQV